MNNDKENKYEKTPLIELCNKINEIDNAIILTQLKCDKEIILLKKEYNDIIYEWYRRFPPLQTDVNIQPMEITEKIQGKGFTR